MKKFLSIFLILFSVVTIAQEDCFPEKPTRVRLVNDFANVFSQREANYLEQKLVAFNDTTSTQIAVVTVNSLCGNDKAQFAYEIGEKWGVGNAKFNNGIVLLFKPKTNDSKGQVFIATGYGLEGVLPDAIGRRIVENEMIPRFKQNDIFGGIDEGVQTIIEITGGEYSAENYNKNGRKSKGFPVTAFFFIGIFIIMMFLNTFKRARAYSSRNNMGLWAALMLMGSMNNRHTGRYNDFTSGGRGFGGFGGGSGGGFGGFGGGSFGGGGAGGSW
jgi:uncharacterized protein